MTVSGRLKFLYVLYVNIYKKGVKNLPSEKDSNSYICKIIL